MRRLFPAVLLAAILTACVCCGHTRTSMPIPASSENSGWVPDILGDDYIMRTVRHPSEGNGRPGALSTIVELPRRDSCCDDSRGVIYIHGFNDYFLQKDMGERIADSCLRFFAVDLRRYGRSLREGDRMFDIRSIHEYFADIDSGVAEMKRQGVRDIVVMGHSTGGLIASLYLNYRPDTCFRGLILNSPFLDWNRPAIEERLLIPAVSMLAPLWPSLTVMPGGDPFYHRPDTLLKEGPWGITRAWKPKEWPSLDAGWVRAIDRAQKELRPGGAANGGRGSDLKMPVLLLHSDSTFRKGMAPEMHDRTDDVLDVADISHYGRALGPNVKEVTIPGAVHDVVRSAPEARDSAYRAIFRFLASPGKDI